MIPIRNINQPTISRNNRFVQKRQPVLVYNARIDRLLKETVVDFEAITVKNVSADWKQFMDGLNSEMFAKISF